MKSGSLSIDFLEEFVYLAESLSFKRTADHFFVSRSVISRHVAALEETLGTRLLERGGHTVGLTNAGDVFYREAKTILRDWEVALDRVRSVEAGAASVVRVGYLRNAARPIIVRAVRRLAETNPEIKLSLQCMEYNELRRAIDEHAVDVALAVNVDPAQSRHYRSTPIYQDSFYVVCAFDHPLAQRSGTLSPEDLRGHKLLLPDSYVYAGLSDIIDDLVDEQALLVAQSFYRDIDMLYLKVQTEGYVAFSSGMNNAMFGQRLAVLPVEGVNTDFSVSAFYHDDFTSAPYAACCKTFEWCREALKDWAPEFTLQFYGQ